MTRCPTGFLILKSLSNFPLSPLSFLPPYPLLSLYFLAVFPLSFYSFSIHSFFYMPMMNVTSLESMENEVIYAMKFSSAPKSVVAVDGRKWETILGLGHWGWNPIINEAVGQSSYFCQSGPFSLESTNFRSWSNSTWHGKFPAFVSCSISS